MSKIQPITPSQIADTKRQIIPDRVLGCWNKFIAFNYSKGRSHFTQNEIIDKLIDEVLCDSDLDYQSKRKMIFNSNWLNVEEIYRAAGWNVVYDKPGYNETYVANFTFTER